MVELIENNSFLDSEVDLTIVSSSSKLAPNGSVSKLSDFDWNMVRTDSFKKWFGDWENNPEKSSKVVGKNGEPLKIYHGTHFNFEKFDWENNLGKNTSNFGIYGPGNYFTVDKTISTKYGSNIFEGFANIKNPKKLLNDVVDLKNTYSLKLIDEFNIKGIPFDVDDVVNLVLETPNKLLALDVLLRGSLIFAKRNYNSAIRAYEDSTKITGLEDYSVFSAKPRVDYFKQTVDSLKDALKNSSKYLSAVQIVPSSDSFVNVDAFVIEYYRLQGHDGVFAYKDTSIFQSSSEIYEGDLSVENVKEIVTYSSDQTK